MSLFLYISAALLCASPVAEGSVRAFVFTDDGQSVVNAAIRVLAQTHRTDAEGSVEIILPPGEYQFAIETDEYPDLLTSPVKILAGQQSEFIVVLRKNGETSLDIEVPEAALEGTRLSTKTATISERIFARDPKQPVELAEMVILAPSLEGGAVFVLQERRDSATVTDVLGADQMSKSGDSDAAGALRRVTGVTIVDGRYVYVRGLGERYSATLLNGSTLPSPDPERRVVPLDLFPAGILSGIEVQKSYSPNLSGEFGGGLVLLRTVDIPEEFHARIGLSGGLRTHTTGRDAISYPGSGLDFLTFGNSARALPDDFYRASKENKFLAGDMFTPGYTSEQLEQFGESLDLRYGVTPHTIPPDFGISGEVGGGFNLFGGKAGLLLGLMSGNEFAWNRKQVRSYIADDRLQNNLRLEEFKRQAALTGLLTAGLDLDKNRLRATISLNRLAEDSARFSRGIFDEDGGAPAQVTRLWWVEQMLVTNQVRGEHQLIKDKLQLDWRYMFSVATRDEPNRREIKYTDDADNGVFKFSDGPSGNQRFYSTLLDFHHDLAADLTYRREVFGGVETTFQAGLAGMLKTRRVDSRRYRYELNGTGADRSEVIVRDPNQIFSSDTIRPGLFAFEEVTLTDDNYLGGQQLFAGYLMSDLGFRDNLRLLAGARLEFSHQVLETKDPIGSDKEIAGDLSNFDLLPALALTWGFVEDMQLRAGFARTINRPNFRELSPARFFDITIGAEFRGNPELDRAAINHFDLRWEWYPSEAETISVAAFLKTFESPIENSVEGGSNLIYKPVNVEGAVNYGLEIDLRKTFEMFSPALESLYFGANLLLVYSRVTIDDAKVTSKNRPLQGQSPYAVNAQLGWDDLESELSLALLFNIFGPRIESVGGLEMSDIYEQPFPTLDFVAKKKYGRFGLGFKASNILDADARSQISADHFTELYSPRRTFSLSFSADLD
jgi:outer membrane receptor protein involved in Fe transport